MSDKQVVYHMIQMGCDPELFLEQGGQIIGAEKVIPEKGLGTSMYDAAKGKLKPSIVLDGVQVELNPAPSHCRAYLGNNIKQSFRILQGHLKGMKDIKASFRSVIEVGEAEFDSLGDKAKALGCMPSLNHYDKAASVSVDPNTFRQRSAGGHIHVGLAIYTPHIMAHREELVPLMDVLVGLPSVLDDRDPLAAERRKIYGRAGEHRLPTHGVEYRTLSNYWIRSYQLMSFVMGLTRLATSVLGTKYFKSKPEGIGVQTGYATYVNSWDAPKELLKDVDLEAVRLAINTNDFVLAKQAYVPVREFIHKHVPEQDFGLNKGNLDNFDYFVDRIQTDGLPFWFPQDPVEHWSNMPEGHSGYGWENFLSEHVAVIEEGNKSHFKVKYGANSY